MKIDDFFLEQEGQIIFKLNFINDINPNFTFQFLQRTPKHIHILQKIAKGNHHLGLLSMEEGFFSSETQQIYGRTAKL